MRTALFVLALLAAPAAAAAHDYRGHGGPGRDSWYIGFGFGPGGGGYVVNDTTVNFRNHHRDVSGMSGDPLQLALQLELGATLSPQLLLGGEISGLVSTSDELGVRTTLATTQLLAVATWFPMERGLFFRGGAGFASLSSEAEDDFAGTTTEDSVSGLGLMGGVGYAFWLGHRFNLTLHADVNTHFYSAGVDQPDRATTLTGYLGFRWY